jgi:hypothetical protein
VKFGFFSDGFKLKSETVSSIDIASLKFKVLQAQGSVY